MSITDDVASVTRQKKDDRSIARHREVSRDSATSGNNGPINATAATAATAMGGGGGGSFSPHAESVLVAGPKVQR